MTGVEVRDKLDLARKDFLRENPEKLGVIHLPQEMAAALRECRGHQLPPGLSGKIMADGIEVLERDGYLGFDVIIDHAIESIQVLEK